MAKQILAKAFRLEKGNNLESLQRQIVSPSYFIRMSDSQGTTKNIPKNAVHTAWQLHNTCRRGIQSLDGRMYQRGKVMEAGWDNSYRLAGPHVHRPGLHDWDPNTIVHAPHSGPSLSSGQCVWTQSESLSVSASFTSTLNLYSWSHPM